MIVGIVSESRPETRTFGSAVSKGRAAVARGEARKERHAGKSNAVKFCCSRTSRSIVARWSHPRRGPQSHSERFISVSRSKTRAVSPFLLSLSLFFVSPFLLPLLLSARLCFSRASASRPPRLFPRVVVNGQRDWTRRKGIHFVPFDGDETQTRPYLFPFSLSLSYCTATSTLSLFAWLWISAADN